MRTQVGKTLPVLLTNNAATGAAGSDLISAVHGDLGGAKTATAYLIVDNAAASDLANVEFWTSNASDFATSGTALAAVASDSTAMIVVTSDMGSLVARGTLNSALSDLTVSSGSIANIVQDGLYQIALRNVARYVVMQYDSDGTGSRYSLAVVAEDLDRAPFPGATTAY